MDNVQSSNGDPNAHQSPEVLTALSGIEDALTTIRNDLTALHDTQALDALQQNLKALSSYTQALRRGVPIWWKLSISKDALTIFISSIALVASGFSLYHTFFPQPDIRLVQGRDIAIRFDSQANDLSADFRSVIANYGGSVDVVTRVEGRLSRSGRAHMAPIELSDDTISMSNANVRMPLPLILHEHSALDTEVAIKRTMGTEVQKGFFDASDLASSGETRAFTLELRLVTQSGIKPEMKFCFEFTGAVLSALKQGTPFTSAVSQCPRTGGG